ncbi:MAG TPA: TetR/AcrR family transcriptional regulator [Azospirillum sp.]|nr:TetR/AcrR family transcriptional regulator [Azospirillum sp.]
MPHESPSPPARRTRRKEARPAEMIEAARDLFIERGFAATKLEDVARRAGVSVGLPYVYFENKAGLFKAVVRESVLPNIRLGEEMVESFPGPTDELLRLIVARFWQMNREPAAGLPKLVVAEATNFPDIARFYMEEVVMRGRRFFARLIQRGIDRGEFRPVDVMQMARVVSAPLSMLTIWTHSLAPHEIDPEATAEGFLDAYLDLVLHGLRAAPKDAPNA